MTGLLVRVGIDGSEDFGSWNAPVNPDFSFVYVPIPEDREQRSGMETPYTAVEPTLTATGKQLPPHLRGQNMHLSPDFEHLTYGDYDNRGKCIGKLKPGDFIVFYAGLKPTSPIPGNHDRLIYALIGQMFVKEMVAFGEVTKDRYHENAKTRCEGYRGYRDNFILRAEPKRSGRYSRCIHFGHFRDGLYRAWPELVDRWGGLLRPNGKPVRGGAIQRSGWGLPSFGRTDEFLKWLAGQDTGKLLHSNW